jgi:hypothetical protein
VSAWPAEFAVSPAPRPVPTPVPEGVSIPKLAAAAGLSPSRVHQLVADADLDVLDAALNFSRANLNTRADSVPSVRHERLREHRNPTRENCYGWLHAASQGRAGQPGPAAPPGVSTERWR